LIINSRPFNPIESDDERQNHIEFDTVINALNYLNEQLNSGETKPFHLGHNKSNMTNAYQRLQQSNNQFLVDGIHHSKLTAGTLQLLIQVCPLLPLSSRSEFQTGLALLLLKNCIFGQELTEIVADDENIDKKNTDRLTDVMSLVNICCLYSNVNEMDLMTHLNIVQNMKRNVKNQHVCEQILRIFESYRT